MIKKIYYLIFGVSFIKFYNWLKTNNSKYYISKYPYIHKTVSFGNKCVLYGNKNNIIIDRNTYLNEVQLFTGEISKIKIGKNCSIGYRVSIKAKTHALSKTFHDENGKHNTIEKDITIGHRCWIGDGVYIKARCV